MRTISLTDKKVTYLPRTKRLLLADGHAEEMVSLRTPAGYFDGKTIVFRSLGLMVDGRGDTAQISEIWETWKGTE